MSFGDISQILKTNFTQMICDNLDEKLIITVNQFGDLENLSFQGN